MSELPSASFEDGFENFDFLFNNFFRIWVNWFRTFVENPSSCSSKLFSMSTKEFLGIFSGKVIDECSRFWSKDFKTFDDSLPAFVSNLHFACLVELFEKAKIWKSIWLSNRFRKLSEKFTDFLQKIFLRFVKVAIFQSTGIFGFLNTHFFKFIFRNWWIFFRKFPEKIFWLLYLKIEHFEETDFF